MASPDQLARWARDAGFTGIDRSAAVAVALAASRGQPDAPRGLFGVGGTGDGAAQTKAAFALHREKGWDAFPAYGSGAYVLWWPTAVAAVAILGSPVRAVPNPVDAIPGAVGEIASGGPLDDAAVALRWLTGEDAWQRILKVGIGVILISIGAVMFSGRGVTWIGGKVTGGAEKADTALGDMFSHVDAFQQARQPQQGGSK